MLHRLVRRTPGLTFVFAALAANLLPIAGLAADGRWTPFGPLVGSLVRLVPDPFVPSTIYAVALSGDPGERVFKSVDGGTTWSLSGTGLANDLYVDGLLADPLRRGTLYAASNTAFYRSDDSGGHWTKVNDATYQPYLPRTAGQLVLAAVPGRNSITLLCATADAVLRSTNGGRSWTRSLAGVGPFSLLADPKLRSGTTGAAYLSTFDGQVRRTLDGGQTWSVVWDASSSPGSGQVVALAIDPRQPQSLVLATNDNLFQSGDRGGHWTPVAGLPADPPARITTVAFDLRAPRALYVARFASVRNVLLGSRDRGATWREQPVPLERPTERLWSDSTAPHLYAASEGAIAHSSDFGATWQERVRSGRPPGSFPPHLRFDRNDPQRRWLTASGLLSTSRDGGKSWSWVPVRVAESNILVFDVAVDPVRSSLLYAGSVIGLLRSRNGGATWLRVDEAPVYSPSLLALLPGPSGPATLLAGDSQLARSADGGATWQVVLTAGEDLPAGQSRGLRSLFVNPGDPRSLYLIADVFLFNPRPAVLRAELYRSRDGGATWTLLENRETHFAFDPAQPQASYRLDERGLFVSDDQGDHWTRLGDAPPPLLPGSTVSSLWLDPATPGTPARFFAVLNAGGIYRTEDEGATWTPANGGLAKVPFPLTLTGDPFVPHQLYLATLESMLEARFP